MIFTYDETIKLAYETAGIGSRHLIMFHGFGLTKEIFDPWMNHLEKVYTVYVIDLFHHGESQRVNGQLTKKQWVAIFDAFLNHLNINTFSLLGFSLGGRFAICSALEFDQRCDELILVAPDGIYKSPWFRLATSQVLKWCFWYLMTHPNQMHRLIVFLIRIRLISKYIGDFVERELGKPENRARVYHAWNDFKPLGYARAELRRKFKAADFKKVLILGKKDIVIPPGKIRPILVDCGFDIKELNKKHHQLIAPETAVLVSATQGSS